MSVIEALFNFSDKDVSGIGKNLLNINILLSKSSSTAEKKYIPNLVGVVDKISKDAETVQHWLDVAGHFLAKDDTLQEFMDKDGLNCLTKFFKLNNKKITNNTLKAIYACTNSLRPKSKDRKNGDKFEAILTTLFGLISSLDDDGIIEFCRVLKAFGSFPRIRDRVISDTKLLEYLTKILDGKQEVVINAAMDVFAGYAETTVPINYRIAYELHIVEKVNCLVSQKKCVSQGYKTLLSISTKKNGADKIKSCAVQSVFEAIKNYNMMNESDVECCINILANVRPDMTAVYFELVLSIVNADNISPNLFASCMRMLSTISITKADGKYSAHFFNVAQRGLEKYGPIALVECLRVMRIHLKNSMCLFKGPKYVRELITSGAFRAQNNYQDVLAEGILILAKYTTLCAKNASKGAFEELISLLKIANVSGNKDNIFENIAEIVISKKDLIQEGEGCIFQFLPKVFDPVSSDLMKLKQLANKRKDYGNNSGKVGSALFEMFYMAIEKEQIGKLIEKVTYETCVEVAAENIESPYFLNFIRALEKRAPKHLIQENTFENILSIFDKVNPDFYCDYMYFVHTLNREKIPTDVATIIEKFVKITCDAESKSVKLRGVVNVNMKLICLELLRAFIGSDAEVYKRFVELNGIRKINDSLSKETNGKIIDAWFKVLRKVLRYKEMEYNPMEIFNSVFNLMKPSNPNYAVENGYYIINELVSAHPELAQAIASDKLFDLIGEDIKKSEKLMRVGKKLVETLFKDEDVKRKYNRYEHLLTDITAIKEPLLQRLFDDIFLETNFSISTILKGIKDTPLPSLDEALKVADLKSYNDISRECLLKTKCLEDDSCFSSLTNDERGAIFGYTLERIDRLETIYKSMNEAMAQRTTGNIRKWRGYIYLLLTALGKCTDVCEGETLYRGMLLDQDIIEKYKAAKRDGVEKTWWSFTSTSKDLETSNSFTVKKEEDDGKKGVIFIIKNAKGYNLDKISNEDGEREVLLEPERKFRVLEVAEFAKKTIITIEITNPNFHILDNL